MDDSATSSDGSSPTRALLQVGRLQRHDDFTSTTRRHLRSLTPGGCVCVVVVEIDHFEALTSLHGAGVGVEVLSSTATRIRDGIRPHNLVTRVEAKGFALVFRHSVLAGSMADIGSRIQQQFDAPLATSVGDIPVTVSIGASTAIAGHADSVGAETLLAQARAAVDAARVLTKGRIAEFDPAMRDHAVQTYRTEQQLRRALSERELSVNYQPIINLDRGTVVGVEALARWNDPRLGPIPPALFIPIAEDCGLINQLGQVVLEDAVRQGAQWNRERGIDALVTVNLSKRQLLDPSLVSVIRNVLDLYELDASRLCLEITESVVMSNVAVSMTVLAQLKDLGVVLAIDDFGIGYSSLSYLRRLPVDILKVDRSFIQSLRARDDRMITKAVIDLAHTLGMTTIAEGVETIDQIEILGALNCDMVQGFLLHEPRSSAELDFGNVDFSELESLMCDESAAATNPANQVSESHDWSFAR